MNAIELMEEIRRQLKDMNDEDRLRFFSDVMRGYCPFCGRDHSGEPRPCQCWRDE